MGAAAYYRGNALISRQVRRAYGLNCPEDRPQPDPVLRPESWGSETRARALKSAKGFVRYERSRGRRPSATDIVDFLSSGGSVPAICGMSTAEAIAKEVV
jgi:hypothetical protein